MKNFIKELDFARPHEADWKTTYALLWEIILLPNPTRTKGKSMLKEEISQRKLEIFNEHDIQSLYQYTVKLYNHRYPRSLIKTNEEKVLYSTLRKSYKGNISTGVWIGRHCIDLLIPSYRIAIEVNGIVHDAPIKMLKDEARDSFLKNTFKIMLLSIDNQDVFRHRWVSNIVTHIRGSPPKKSHVVRHLWLDIHIATISQFYSLKELSHHLHCDLVALSKIFFNKKGN